MSIPAASRKTNGSPNSVCEHGREKSIQFRSAAFGEQAMYTKRFSPRAFRIACFDRDSGNSNLYKNDDFLKTW